MNEADRKQRNYIKIHELHPSIRQRMEAVLHELESFGYRPRIQEAWVSPNTQLARYYAGKSSQKYTFHNVTADDGTTKEALAADIWDDDRPTSPKSHFMLHLLAAAENNGFTTGIRISLSENRIKFIENAVAKKDWMRPVWVGADPLHVEVTSLTVQDAEAGKRPAINPSEPTGTLPDNTDIPEPNDNAGDWETYEPEPIKYRVEDVTSNYSKEYELKSALRPVTLLTVPYISQLGPGADSRHNDCGAAASAMILAAYTGTFITPNGFYDKFEISGDPYLTVDHVRNALASEGLPTDFKSDIEMKSLFELLQAGKPVILPINYNILHDAGLTETTFVGPHFSVAVGMDTQNIYVHDPLFTDPEDGNAHAYPVDEFLKAWIASTHITGYSIPKCSAIIPTIAIGETPVEEAPTIAVLKRVKIMISRLNVRKGPGTNHPVVGSVLRSEEFNLLNETGGWGEIAADQWIALSYTQTVSSSGTGSSKGGTVQPEPGDGVLLKINLASSVPQNPTGVRAAQYIFSDPAIPSMHRNLCGDLTLSMIYETATNKQNSLGYIYQGSKHTTRGSIEGSNAYEFSQQFANTFPAGWKAQTYYLNYLYYFEAGNPYHMPSSPGVLNASQSLKTLSNAEIKSMISKALADHNFLVVGVKQSTLMSGSGAARLNPRGIGHWVVIAGTTASYVYINNPFMNRRETYTWDEFMESFGYWIVQITPASNYQPQFYSGSMNKVHESLEQDRNKL